MFCPNCGNNCGDARFCTACGTQLRDIKVQEQQADKSATNAACDHATVNQKKREGSTQIPTSGGYLGVSGSLVLFDSSLSVCVNSLFKKTRTQIPYNQLTTVIYARPQKQHANGVLLLRGESNKNIPIPKNLIGDKSAISFSQEQDTLFYHIFWMLKAVAPTTARFQMIVPQAPKAAVESVNMDYFFRYAPHRERTTDAICAKHGLPKETARALVNQFFDAKQKAAYAADPLDAIRDLNLIVADMRRREQRNNQADAERRKRQEQEAIRSSLESLERMKTLEMLDDYLDNRE